VRKFEPKYPKSLVMQIHEYLSDAILDGRLEAGQRLVEAELQRSLGVSRTPIREALRILEQEGFVINVNRKGSYVRRPSQADVIENFPVRAWLEGLAARFAITRMDDEGVTRIAAALTEMEEAAKKNEFKRYYGAHERFHMEFITVSGNMLLIDLLKKLRRHNLWFRFSYKWHRENYERALPIHREILRLFQKRDEDRVELAVRKHILDNQTAYLEYLEGLLQKEILLTNSRVLPPPERL